MSRIVKRKSKLQQYLEGCATVLFMLVLVYIVFTYRIAFVPTDSMYPAILPGQTVLFTKVQFDNIVNGDIVIYNSDYYGVRIVHRVVATGYNNSDTKLYRFIRTQGDNNRLQDPECVTKEMYLGKVIYICKNKYINNLVVWINSLEIVSRVIMAVIIMLLGFVYILIHELRNRKREDFITKFWQLYDEVHSTVDLGMTELVDFHNDNNELKIHELQNKVNNYAYELKEYKFSKRDYVYLKKQLEELSMFFVDYFELRNKNYIYNVFIGKEDPNDSYSEDKGYVIVQPLELERNSHGYFEEK